MRTDKRNFALLLGLLLLAPVTASADDPIGHLTDWKRVVEAIPPGREIAPTQEVYKNTAVETHKDAGAMITVGTSPALRGMVKLGPETSLTFKEWVVDMATGKVKEVGLSVALGHFLAAFIPTTDDVLIEPGVDKWIETPQVRKIRLEGTMVDVQVTPEATTVLVIEGAATVESRAGGTVRLTAGTRTVVRADQPPTLPAPADPGTGTLSPPAAGPTFHGPGWVIVDPTRVDLQRDFVLDLPRLDRP